MGFLFKFSLFIPLLAAAILYFRPDLVLDQQQTVKLQEITSKIQQQANQWINEQISQTVKHEDAPVKQQSQQTDQQTDPQSHQPTEKPEQEACLKSGQRLFTLEQLKVYDGSDPSKGIYLAFLGQVYDVEKGRKHYGPGGSYSMFAGKDASRAYLTGDFSDSELVQDIFGLPEDTYTALREWEDFYQSEYDVIGKVSGFFYDESGCPTDKLTSAWALVAQANQITDELEQDELSFPACNTEWNQSDNTTRVWCTDKSGGYVREWVGKPRRLYNPKHQSYRCACVKDFGPPTVSFTQYADADNSAAKPSDSQQPTNHGDLHNPRVSEFENCDSQSVQCIIKDNYAQPDA